MGQDLRQMFATEGAADARQHVGTAASKNEGGGQQGDVVEMEGIGMVIPLKHCQT